VNAPRLLALGILPCPLAYGALFDGGLTGTSRPMDAHIARGTCRARWLGASPPRRELDGPYMPTTTSGVSAVLSSQPTHAHLDPMSTLVSSAAVTFSAANPTFTKIHLRTSETQSAAALLAHALSILMPLIVDLLSRTHYTRRAALRDAAQETLLLFPALALGPQGPGASSSSVRIEVASRLDLWRRGDLHELARRA